MKKTFYRRWFSFVSVFTLLAAFLLTVPAKVQAMSFSINEISTDEEYMEFLRRQDPAIGFVKYRDIRSLGEFSEFGYVGDTGGYVYNYMFYHEYTYYTVTDENNIRISIEITRKNSYLHSRYHHLEEQPITQSSDTTDMRLLSTAENGALQRGSLLYIYLDGKLSDIIFSLGDTCFHISGDLDTYPMDGEETIVSRMLSIDDKVAEKAYRKLIADIPAQPGYYKPLIVDIAIILCVTVCACVALVIIIKRIRKRK